MYLEEPRKVRDLELFLLHPALSYRGHEQDVCHKRNQSSLTSTTVLHYFA